MKSPIFMHCLTDISFWKCILSLYLRYAIYDRDTICYNGDLTYFLNYTVSNQVEIAGVAFILQGINANTTDTRDKK